MRVLLLITLFNFVISRSTCQKIRLGDTAEVSFGKLDKVILDSAKLCVSIVYTNNSTRTIYVYSGLKEGYFNDRFRNFNVSMQKLENGKYTNQQGGVYYRRSAELEYADSLRHYDLPKTGLLPKQKSVLTYNLHDLKIPFDTGEYRIKIKLRSRTIWNKTPYHFDPTGETAPPEDEIQYVTSDWIYFRILKKGL